MTEPRSFPQISAPEVAVLRMAAELEAGGVPVTDRYLVDRAVAARGILLNPGNRARYGTLVDGLVASGFLDARPADELGADGIITITDRGTLVLVEQQQGRTS